MFSENPRGFMVLKKISEIMVFETLALLHSYLYELHKTAATPIL